MKKNIYLCIIKNSYMSHQYLRRQIFSLTTALLLVGSLFCCSSQAQDIRFPGLWTGVFFHNHIGSWDWNTSLSNLANLEDRNFEGIDYPVSAVRFQFVNLISYHHNQHWYFSTGLHYQRNYPFDDRYNNEFRPFEQIEFRHKISKMAVTHMLRLNQRFIEVKADKEYSLNHSFQYKTSLNIPLRIISEHKKLYLSAYSEEYFGISGPFIDDSFCEFWLYAAVGFQWRYSSRLEIGIGHEYLVRNSLLDTRISWYPAINYIAQFNWHRA